MQGSGNERSGIYKGESMSKFNGDKARQNLRDRKQAKMRVRNQALRATMKAPLKTMIAPEPVEGKSTK
jgi:hypothetical protein